MAELLINQWGWIGDSELLQSGNDIFDAQWLDLETWRSIKLSINFSWADWRELMISPTSTTFKKATDNTSYATALSNTTDWKIYNKLTSTLNSTWYRSDTHFTVGNTNDTYDVTTAPNGMRHFMIWYDTGHIVYTNWSWSTINTIDVSANTLLKENNWLPWAMEMVWKWSLLFAYGNNIFEINPNPNTPVLNGVKIELENGAFVWNISYINWLIHIIYTLNDDTIIRTCSYDGTTYKLTNYCNKIQWKLCIWSATNNWVIYWVSSDTLFLYDWQNNTILKTLYIRNTDKYFYNISLNWVWSTCSFYDWFLYISSTTWYYKYWTKKPNKRQNLVFIPLATGRKIETWANWWKAIIFVVRATFSDRIYLTSEPTTSAYWTWFAILPAYTAGQYWTYKKWLAIRIGYNLRKTQWWSILVYATTDKIIRNNTTEQYSNYVLLATITDPNEQRFDITKWMLSKALWDAWYSDVFSLMKIKIDLVGGWNWSWTYPIEQWYPNTPEVFDIYISHEEIDNEI